MLRRDALKSLGAVLAGVPLHTLAVKAARKSKPTILFFSRSVLFEHSVVKREGNQLSFAERTFVELARRVGCDVDCTKDGRVFDRDLARYAMVASYTCGRSTDLMRAESKDHSPALTELGWKNLDRAVRGGKPLLGIHPGLWLAPEAFGADVIGHGSQQTAKMLVASPNFPGAEGLGSSFDLYEEWFSLVKFAKDLHVILVQDCAGMSKEEPADRRCYDRPPFPATWARRHGQGRVFYTSMGHREDVWTSCQFQQLLGGALAWLLGHVEADITPNVDKYTA
jgi:type 1 glutamine amidotransferase